MSILILCAVIVAAVIIIGTKTKINIGLWAIAAAYILGAYILKIKPGDIINLWPTKLFLMLFAVTFFYSFAIQNGSLEKLAMIAVYKCKNAPWAIPIVIFVLGFVMSGIGAGDGAIVLLLPIAMSIAKITGMNYFLAACSAMCTISFGGLTPISTIGIFIRGLMEQAKFSPEAANAFANRALLHGFAVFTIIFIAAYIIFKGYKLKSPDIEEPAPFEGKQKITLAIICCYVAVMVLLPLLKTLFPKVAAIVFINSNLQIALVSFFFALISLIFRVGDEKKAFARVPWGAFTTLCGMSMLISIVTQSGTIKIISGFLSTHVSATLSPVLLALFSGIMSFFVSGFVVNTTFFPLVPGLATGAGVDPGLLYSAIAIGALTTAVSPFSSAGALCVSCVDDEEKRPMIFNALIAWAGVNVVVYIALILLGL